MAAIDTLTDAKAWHVAAVLRSFGGRRIYAGARDFVFYAQRYIDDPSTRYTGEILLQSFTSEADALSVCERLNADPARPHHSRRTYL